MERPPILAIGGLCFWYSGIVAGIDVDVGQWPVVFIRFDGDQNQDELSGYFRQMAAAVHGRKQPYVVISWLKRYSHNREAVRRVGAWMKETEPLTRAYCVASANVTQSAGFRFVLSSVFLIRP